MTEPTQPTPAPKDRTDGVRVSLPPDARPAEAASPGRTQTWSPTS